MKTSNINKIGIKWQKCLKKGVNLVWGKNALFCNCWIFVRFWRNQSFHEKFTYSGTLWHMSWSRVPLEKLILAQLSTKLPAFYETQMVIITFTRAHNWTPVYAISIHTTTLLAVPPGWIWFRMLPSNSTKVLVAS
jgi:hypothetical protein